MKTQYLYIGLIFYEKKYCKICSVWYWKIIDKYWHRKNIDIISRFYLKKEKNHSKFVWPFCKSVMVSIYVAIFLFFIYWYFCQPSVHACHTLHYFFFSESTNSCSTLISNTKLVKYFSPLSQYIYCSLKHIFFLFFFQIILTQFVNPAG